MEESSDKIYAQHRGLIRSLINSIVVNNPSVVDIKDLQQTGALALILALRSYDPSLGSFQSYIRKCIRNALLEQANSFNSIFTVDEKVRRQANAIIKMRAEGLSDDMIMTRLGVKTRVTFLSLLRLVEGYSVDLENIETETDIAIESKNVLRMLDEIGLSQLEIGLVDLIISNHSIDEIIVEMNISRSRFFEIKSSIREKILEWGQEK